MPLVVTVWSGDIGTRHGWIGDPLMVRVTERYNDVSTGEVEVAADHHLVPILATPGTRLTVDHVTPAGTRRILSGPIRGIRGDGPASTGSMILGVEGDWRLLTRVLGWPVPTAALNAQTVAYYTATGPAETVAKDVITANAITRLGLPVVVATDLARGSTVKLLWRFHPLADRMFPAVEAAGLGVTVVQDDTTGTLLVDVTEPALYPRNLTEVGGVVLDWSWSLAGPTGTRVIAGDQGEAAARSFTTTVDATRESTWDDVVETFRDARDTDDATALTQRRQDTLTEGAPTSGLGMTLAETSIFRIGPGGVLVGDMVPVQVGPGVVITDVIRAANYEWTARGGFAVTAQLGDRTDSPEVEQARAIRQIARGQRALMTGR